MRIGILSDSHDQVWNLEIALDALATEADLLVHCGDLCSPFIVPLLAGRFPGPVHAVFGNNDADRYRLQALAAKTGRVRLEGESWFPELGGKRFAVQHFHDLADPLAASGRFDVVCFGHNHRLEVERSDGVWRINPGAIMGWVPGGQGAVAPSFVVFDSERDDAVVWRIEDGVASAAVG